MAELRIYQDSYVDATVISNRFIDEYMIEANDAQIKVYLYLIRMMSAHLSTSVSDLADHFNHTEKDILRALKYWEKKGILALEYDGSKNLCGIHLMDLGSDSHPVVQAAPAPQTISMAQPLSAPQSIAATQAVQSVPTTPVSAVRAAAVQTEQAALVARAEQELSALQHTPILEAVVQVQPPVWDHGSYSIDRKSQFKNQSKMVMYVVNSYIGRPLSHSEIDSLIFIKDELGFSDDLIDYLFQYCVDLKKKDFRYIEKVAISWKEHNITSEEEAKTYIKRYRKDVFTIMKLLGKNGTPTDVEFDYISKWLDEYAFSQEVIVEACKRTVLATDQNRLQYAEGILRKWHEKNVHNTQDIEKLDAQHKKKQASDGGNGSGAASGATSGSGRKYNAPAAKPASSFHQFQQSDVDYDELEKQLMRN